MNINLIHISINHKKISLTGREKDGGKRIYLQGITSGTPCSVSHEKINEYNTSGEASSSFSLKSALMKNNKNANSKVNTAQKHRSEKENYSEERWKKPHQSKFIYIHCIGFFQRLLSIKKSRTHFFPVCRGGSVCFSFDSSFEIGSPIIEKRSKSSKWQH